MYSKAIVVECFIGLVLSWYVCIRDRSDPERVLALPLKTRLVASGERWVAFLCAVLNEIKQSYTICSTVWVNPIQTV